MADFVETAVIIEKVIEKLYNLKKFNQFILLCNAYHMDICEHDYYDNCNFIINLENIYFKHYLDELNGIESLQNFDDDCVAYIVRSYHFETTHV